MNKLFDVIIIGAGPAGIACAIESHKSGLKYLLVDKGGVVNSIQQFQRDMFFFSTPELLEIGNVPFIVPTTRPTSLDCVKYYRRVVEHYNLAIQFYQDIIGVKKHDGIFFLGSSTGNTFQSKAVVIATGYYDTPTPLNVPGEELPHVSHFYRDALPFYKQHVLIVGGKNSAVEAALDLYRHGASVTVVHRGDALSPGVKYWILPDFENRVKEGSITLQLKTVVKEFRQGMTIVENQNGTRTEIKTDFAFVLIGYLPDVAFLRSVGINVDVETLAPQCHPETFETNVPGLFVAGGLVGGKFNNKVFIENGREHGKNIIEALKKKLNHRLPLT
ncbi:MAG: YpdA family putative bacillithiol disulfide reductase [Ignavibacteriae bacterium]|nr:YpdA family putative bacillithiol disulfide reductase [Ignavibacteriota bacterium]